MGLRLRSRWNLLQVAVLVLRERISRPILAKSGIRGQTFYQRRETVNIAASGAPKNRILFVHSRIFRFKLTRLDLLQYRLR